MKQYKVLCVVAAGFEEIELVAPVDLLRRAGAHVTMASLTGERSVLGRNEMTLEMDAAFAEVSHHEFDLLLIPGGPGVAALREDGRTAPLAAEYLQGGKLVGAICAGPLVLADVGLLEGRQFTAHFSVLEELPDAVQGRRVVEDGALITASGAGAALDFGLTLVRRLFGDEKALEVATAIMA